MCVGRLRSLECVSVRAGGCLFVFVCACLRPFVCYLCACVCRCVCASVGLKIAQAMPASPVSPISSPFLLPVSLSLSRSLPPMMMMILVSFCQPNAHYNDSFGISFPFQNPPVPPDACQPNWLEFMAKNIKTGSSHTHTHTRPHTETRIIQEQENLASCF